MIDVDESKEYESKPDMNCPDCGGLLRWEPLAEEYYHVDSLEKLARRTAKDRGVIDVDESNYDDIRMAIEDAIQDIEKYDSHVTRIEIHGPHSGYVIEFQGFGAPEGAIWKSTPIEK